MGTEITNLAQLKARIAFLEIKKIDDEIYFEQKFESIKNKVHHPFKFVKDMVSAIVFGGNTTGLANADWATSLGRIFFPLFLNKTLLKNSGVIMKTLVSLVSQKAINYSVFNKDVLSGWIDSVTDFVKSKTKKEKRYGIDDYGIPPESETA
ncbi:hypothetical protein [Pedobacter arcticus]|uniref:hypothetical protein n=1 Tax=Pedobacter arcticus TaxID=752140 RepID=UPI0002FC0ED5|nr:hypothetical protein [Pedobacter arcticus]